MAASAMNWREAVVIAVTLFVAVIVQYTLLSRLGLPGATPDLVVVCVVALALAMGPTQGAVAGFVAGVLVDLAPPGGTLLGVNAIVYIAIGFITGFAVDPRDRTVALMIGMVSLSAAAATLLTAALDTMLGSPQVSWDSVPLMVLTSALYAAILAPPAILGAGWLGRRLASDVSVIGS